MMPSLVAALLTALIAWPAPFSFLLDGETREAVMDSEPWSYAIAAAEMRREGKVAEDPPPGLNKIATATPLPVGTRPSDIPAIQVRAFELPPAEGKGSQTIRPGGDPFEIRIR
jgi:hypothetical protein